MKRVLIDRLINDFEEKINNAQDYMPLDITDASPPFTIDTATFYEFKEYVLIALKQLGSKMKKITIAVGNSNNYTGYSILSGKSEAIESGYGFMGIVGYKIIFKWLKNLIRYIYIDIRDLTLHFEDGTVISGTTHDPNDLDDSNVFTSGALTSIFQKIKEIVTVYEILEEMKKILQNQLKR
jgi:hypothetical protein